MENEYTYLKLGPEHNYGQCIISDNYKLIYILIPKNASSTMRTYIKNKLNGYEFNYFHCNEEQKKYYTFCIFRNIEDRFYSAINTILIRKKNDISNMNNNTIHHFVDNMIDEHLVRQVEFIKNIRIDYYLNFDYLHNLIQKINSRNKNINEKTIIKIDINTLQNVYKTDQEIYNNIIVLDQNKYGEFTQKLFF
jgi:hypothetical protein